MGIEWRKPTKVPEKLEPFVICESDTGYPTSVIRPDGDWARYVEEEWKDEVGWTMSGGYAPTIFDIEVLVKQLEYFITPARGPQNFEAWRGGCAILQEALQIEIGTISEYTMQEAVFGSNDGLLAAIPFDTGSGFGLHKLAPKKLELFSDHLDFLIYLLYDDWERLGDESRSLLVWPPKGSLKDARLPVEKLAKKKGRLFSGSNTISSVSGRRVMGNFVGKFAERSAKGGFFGVVSYVLARGGWHDLVRELTQDFVVTEVNDFDVAHWDKDYIRIVQYHVMIAVCMLAADPLHKIRLWRHYERVFASPIFVTIAGWLMYLFKGWHSGDIATVVINSLGQALVYMYIFCQFTPKEMWTYSHFKRNIFLKTMGDDGANTLSVTFESSLPRGWVDIVIEGFAEFNWEVEMPRDPQRPGKVDDDFSFSGHKSLLVTVPTMVGEQTYALPVLPFPVVLSINEWRKLKKSPDIPEAVRDLARYQAAWERAFPYLWHKDEDKKNFARIAWFYLCRKRATCLVSVSELTRKAAEGLPSIMDLIRLYFPPLVDVFAINQEVLHLLA